MARAPIPKKPYVAKSKVFGSRTIIPKIAIVVKGMNKMDAIIIPIDDIE
jgi:hypothetical protein